MKVSDLKKELEKYPDDTIVKIEDWQEGYLPPSEDVLLIFLDLKRNSHPVLIISEGR